MCRRYRRTAAVVIRLSKATAGQAWPGVGRDQPPLYQPGPERARRQDRVRPEVRLVGPVGAPGPSAQLIVGLEQPHRGALLGARDGGHQPGDAAADNVDLGHGGTVWGNWPLVKVQLCLDRMSQSPWARSCCSSCVAAPA